MTDDPTPDPTAPEGEELRPAVDPTLRGAVLELEQHAAAGGWDQPAQLFALVPARDLMAQDPALAAAVGLAEGTHPDTLVTVEQGELPAEIPLEQLLTQIEWPDEVRGAAVVVERVVLPPSAGELPEDPEEAAAFALAHPEREEVRIIAAALRSAGVDAATSATAGRVSGSTYAAMRLRSRDDDFAVLESPDLVPGLLELVASTLGIGPQDQDRRAPGLDAPEQ